MSFKNSPWRKQEYLRCSSSSTVLNIHLREGLKKQKWNFPLRSCSNQYKSKNRGRRRINSLKKSWRRHLRAWWNFKMLCWYKLNVKARHPTSFFLVVVKYKEYSLSMQYHEGSEILKGQGQYTTHSQMLGKFEYTLPAKFWRLVGCTEMLSW